MLNRGSKFTPKFMKNAVQMLTIVNGFWKIVLTIVTTRRSMQRNPIYVLWLCQWKKGIRCQCHGHDVQLPEAEVQLQVKERRASYLNGKIFACLAFAWMGSKIWKMWKHCSNLQHFDFPKNVRYNFSAVYLSTHYKLSDIDLGIRWVDSYCKAAQRMWRREMRQARGQA